jgi:hypothetical protein
MINFELMDRQTCDRIRGNDPSLDHVNTYHMANEGYGRPLGGALLQNTIVTRIDIDTGSFFGSEEDEDNSEPLAMLQYIRTSTVLCTVSLGRRISRRPSMSNPRLSLVRDIIVAVGQSQHLTTFISDVTLPADDFCSFLTTTKTVREMELSRRCLEGFCSLVDGDINRLIDCVEINQSMSSLSMEFSRSTDDLVERIMERLDQRAAASSSSFISVTVTCSSDVRKFVPQSTRVLQTLSFMCSEFDEESTPLQE